MADVEVDWGDGTSSTVVVADTDDWSFEGETHTYDDPNFYLVTVTGPEGGKASQQVDVEAPPLSVMLTSITPNSVVVDSPARIYTLTGTGFLPSHAVGLKFDQFPDFNTNMPQSITPTEITFEATGANFGFEPGTTEIVIIDDPLGAAEQVSNIITVPLVAPAPEPTITSLNPTTWVSGGGTVVTVQGTNLTLAGGISLFTSPGAVSGGAGAPLVGASDTSRTVVFTPAGPGTYVEAMLSTPGGDWIESSRISVNIVVT